MSSTLFISSAFVNVFALATFPLLSVSADTVVATWIILTILSGMTGVGIVGTFVVVVAFIGDRVESEAAWAVFVADETAIGVDAYFILIAILSAFAAFVDVFAYSVLVLISIRTDAVVILFDKSGFTFAFVADLLVLVVFSAVIATVGAFVAYIDVDTDAVLLSISIRIYIAAILFNEAATALGTALVLTLAFRIVSHLITDFL